MYSVQYFAGHLTCSQAYMCTFELGIWPMRNVSDYITTLTMYRTYTLLWLVNQKFKGLSRDLHIYIHMHATHRLRRTQFSLSAVLWPVWLVWGCSGCNETWQCHRRGRTWCQTAADPPQGNRDRRQRGTTWQTRVSSSHGSWQTWETANKRVPFLKCVCGGRGEGVRMELWWVVRYISGSPTQADIVGGRGLSPQQLISFPNRHISILN